MSQTAHQFDPSILREYDIRGIVGGSVHVADARAIGRTFGTMVRRKGGRHVALGYDGRLSSPELAAACIEGLTAAGVDVTHIGVAATPMLYFAVYHLAADGVVILTEWNEFRALDFAKVKAALKQPLMVDLRNIYRPSQMAQAGFRYVSVGRADAGT